MKIQNVLTMKVPNELENKPFKKVKVIPKVGKSVYGVNAAPGGGPAAGGGGAAGGGK